MVLIFEYEPGKYVVIFETGVKTTEGINLDSPEVTTLPEGNID